MYRIRFHGRGGQGIKTASQMLGTAFFRAGFEIQDAPRYGAERRGAPIFAYVRAARTPIMERGVIDHPDLVIVADETLVPLPAAGVLQGVGDRTTLLLCSTEPAAAWQDRLKFVGPVHTLPHSATANGNGERHASGASCAGAAARLVGVISRDLLAQAVRDELAKFGPAAVASGLEHALAAFDAMAPATGCVSPGPVTAARNFRPPEWIELPLDAAAVAAPDIHAAATSELAKTGTWRTHTPEIDYAHCNRCSWICSTYCPDGAIAVEADRTPRIDLDHCKGCLVCIGVCPPHAIRAVVTAASRREEVREARAATSAEKVSP